MEVMEALEKYPTTLDHDREIIHDNEADHTLSLNAINCILFRSTEKSILLILEKCSLRMEILLKLDREEATI